MTELAQDLAKKLGLKGRKAYVSPQTESTGTEGENLGETSSPTGEVGDVCNAYSDIWLFGLKYFSVHLQMSSNGLESLGDIGPGMTELLPH